MNSQFDFVIRNGTVVTVAGKNNRDVGIRKGKIAAISEALPPCDRDMDATGKLVLPGGIDSHCHIDQRSSMGVVTADDFYTGGVSAACGGVTTIIPFAAQHRRESLRTAVEEYHRRAEGKAFIDYAFHMIISDPTPQVLNEELPDLIREGHTSFKIYLTYDSLRLTDRQALDVLAAARRDGALAMAHAENHDGIAWITEGLLKEGKTAPRFHALARPPAVEREAIHRAISLAEIVDVPILIVHVSSADGIEQVRWARDRGLEIYAETCPQYLLLTAEAMDRPGFEGAQFICSPPLRDRVSQEALWRGIETGVFQVISSDHAPYRFDDPRGKKVHGDNVPFSKVPSGLPGLEVCMPLLFSEGVRKGRIGLETFVGLTSTNAAQIYGLYPRKGTIAVGSDADLAVWDPDLEVTISRVALHDNMDYTPYEGMKVRGWPAATISRGEIIWEYGKVNGAPGRGEFLPCTPPLSR